jgi:hypothetical protein
MEGGGGKREEHAACFPHTHMHTRRPPHAARHASVVPVAAVSVPSRRTTSERCEKRKRGRKARPVRCKPKTQTEMKVQDKQTSTRLKTERGVGGHTSTRSAPTLAHATPITR